MFWMVAPSGKFEPSGAALADRHYSRRTPGSNQFMPPGQTLVLVTPRGDAVFGWWRPHPNAGIKSMNNLDGWTCTIFRNESQHLSSEMILEAEKMLLEKYDCGPDGLITYVWDRKIRSVNPGFCFKKAGWRVTGRSADNRKTLLQKLINAPYRAGASAPGGEPDALSPRLPVGTR